MFVMVRLFCALLMLGWVNMAQADDVRFQVTLDFADAGVAPSIPDQAQLALPQLWQRIVPQQEIPALNDISAMSLLKSIHPQGLQSTVEFNEQRVWQTLASRSVPYISPLPSFYITLDVLDTSGHHNTPMEVQLQSYLDQLSQTLGIQRRNSAPLLALHVQWLNDRQFYISVVQPGHATQQEQNQAAQGADVMQPLQESLQRILLQVRQQFVVETGLPQPASGDKPTPVETQTFTLQIVGQGSLANQILLETALQSDARVQSMTPILIDANEQTYQVVSKQAPESWLAFWFAEHGMKASLGLAGWQAQ